MGRYVYVKTADGAVRIRLMRREAGKERKAEGEDLSTTQAQKVHFGYFHQRFGDGLPAQLALAFNAVAKADG
jgi:hypothetical protein